MGTSTKTPPYTIGLLIGSAEDRYENSLLRGIYDELADGKHRVVSFTSGGIRSFRGFESQANVLYDLIAPHRIDGLILSGAVSHTIDREEMLRFCQHYAPLPILGVAIDLPGLHRLVVESYSGIQQIVEHLVTHHQRKRLAFIRGPKDSPEAEDRFLAYQETLKAHQLGWDASWVAQGDYTYDSGCAAMQMLLETHSDEIDAVVSANDSMALGAIEVLQGRGYRVPNDIAVTGFDDALEARFASPPLTTIRQLVYRQGRQAAETILGLVRGESVPERQKAPVQIVLRKSCGCDQYGPGILSHIQSLAAPADLPTALNQLLSGIPIELGLSWTTELVRALYADLSKAPGRFLERFSVILRNPEAVGIDGQTWLQILAVLRYRLLLHLPRAAARQVEDLIQNAQGLVSATIEQRQLAVQVRRDRSLTALRELEEVLFTTTTLSELLQAIAAELPRLGVVACSIALFEDPLQPAKEARQLLAYNPQKKHVFPEGRRFPGRDLAPDDTWNWNERQNVVVEALYSGSARLGFALFDLPIDLVEICGVLRGLLSGALQNILLLDARRVAEERLRETNKEVERKARDLERFTYSVAHDLKGPLRGLDGYSCLLLSDYSEHLGEEGQSFLKHIRQATQQMHRLIAGLLDYSNLERHPVLLEAVPLRPLVDQVIQQRWAEFDEVDFFLSVDVPEIIILAEADELMLALQQLLDNAIKFSQETVKPRIAIQARTQGAYCWLIIQDNGIGFEMEYHDRIFEIFQRLNRAEDYPGAGAGLALVYRVMQRIRGRVWAESASGIGATFYLEIPLAPA